MKMRWMMMACLSLFGATACDLPDKQIGDETQGDSVDPGGECTPGDVMPADDGCNTCECLEDGSGWACTLIGCDPTAGTGETGDPTGGECDPGDEMVADDGCNTCQCLDNGTWACTLLACEPECEPGTTVPAPDGCNTCECNADGTIGACTAIGCVPGDTDPFDGPALSSCEPTTPFDDLVVSGATLEGDTLTLNVAYTGCSPGHPLGGCWDGFFLESFPVQVDIDVAHDDLGEACDAFPSDSVDIDLTPLREAYAEAYEPSGTIMINVAGLDGAVEYSF